MQIQLNFRPVTPGSRNRVLEIKGQLETNTVPQFEALTKSELEQTTHNWVLLARDLEYISSAGLAALLAMRHKLEEKKCRFCMVALNPRVAKVFQLLGMTPLFEFFDDEASALAALKGK